MSKIAKILLTLIFLTPGFAARSQTAYTGTPSTEPPARALDVEGNIRIVETEDSIHLVLRKHKPPVVIHDTVYVNRDESTLTTGKVFGDTLRMTPAMIDSLRFNPAVEEYERNLESVDFVPKGQWIAGLSLSYTQGNYNDYQFLVLQSIKGDTYSVKVSPKVLYAFRNDMAIGVKFEYARSLTKLEKAEVSLGEGSEFDVNYLYSLGHNYYGTLLFRNYFSLGRTKRFGLFNEVQLQLGGGQSKLTKGRGESLTGAYERNFKASIGIAPGLVIFLNNYSAMEVNIGVLGFSYRDTKTINDRIYVSHRKLQSFNFNINLFSITFGAAFYL